MAESTLLQLQQLFKADILNKTHAIVKHLNDSSNVSLSRRVSVYQNNAQLTIESVVEDFPILEETIGNKRLHELVESFLNERPSKSSNRAFISGGFPKYLKDQGENLLSAIAHFDWAQILSSSEPEIENDFRPISDLNSDDVELIVDPTLQLFHSKFAVHRDNEKGDTFLMIRFRGEIEIDELTKPHFLLLQSIVEQTEMPELELSEEEISQAFSEWVKTGIIIGFRKKELQP